MQDTPLTKDDRLRVGRRRIDIIPYRVLRGIADLLLMLQGRERELLDYVQTADGIMDHGEIVSEFQTMIAEEYQRRSAFLIALSDRAIEYTVDRDDADLADS